MDDITKLLQMQALQVPPDQQQMQTVPNAQGVPFYLQAQNAPAQASVPQSPGAEMAPAIPAPAPKPAGLSSYLNQDKPTEESLFSQYGEASKRAQDDQEKGLGALQDYINQIKGKPQGINFTPLAAYIDSINPGSKLTEAAKQMAPQSEEDRDKQLFDLQNKLQGDRGALSNARAKSLGDQLLAMRQERHQTEAERHNRAMEANGANGQGFRGEVMKDEQTAKAKDRVTRDDQLKQHQQRIQGADRILSQLDEVRQGHIVDTQQFLNDLNSEYVNLLRGSNNSALGHLERTEYKTYAGQIAEIRQQLTAHPESINSPEILKHLEASVKSLRNNYQKNLNARADSLRRDYKYNAPASEANHSAVDEVKAMYAEMPQPMAAAVGPKGPSVTQGGHTYNWNPKTGQYE